MPEPSDKIYPAGAADSGRQSGGSEKNDRQGGRPFGRPFCFAATCGESFNMAEGQTIGQLKANCLLAEILRTSSHLVRCTLVSRRTLSTLPLEDEVGTGVNAVPKGKGPDWLCICRGYIALETEMLGRRGMVPKTITRC